MNTACFACDHVDMKSHWKENVYYRSVNGGHHAFFGYLHYMKVETRHQFMIGRYRRNICFGFGKRP